MTIYCYCCNSHLQKSRNKLSAKPLNVLVLCEKITQTHFSNQGWDELVTGRSYVHYFCSPSCWHASVFDMQEKFDLRITHPEITRRVMDCCQCEQPMYRDQPHVSFSLISGTLESRGKNRELNIKCVSEVEVAALCGVCMPIDQSNAYMCEDFIPDRVC